MTDLEKRQIEDLRKQGNGYKKIAQLTGLSINTVKSFCRRIGTVSSSQCMQCGKEITQVKGRKEKKFCCDACRMKWWNSNQDQVKRKAVYEFTCQACGTTFTAYGNAHRKYCCRECYLIGRYGRKEHAAIAKTRQCRTWSYPLRNIIKRCGTLLLATDIITGLQKASQELIRIR